MPKAISVIHEILRAESVTVPERYQLLIACDSVLGLGVADWQLEEISIPDEIQSLVDQRNAARAQRRFSDADALRAQIADRGYVLEDTKDGVKVKPAEGRKTV